MLSFLPTHLQLTGGATRSDDLIAGFITAILLIPQGMAYALLAGLPAQAGLYASIVPPVVYALTGSSRTLSVGPVAVAALMVATALAEHADGDVQRWSNGALILAAESGLILLAMRALRLGRLVSFVSHPVLSGFTSGAALLIIVSQLSHLSGITIAAGTPWEQLAALWQGRTHYHATALLIGVVSAVTLLLGRAPLIRLLTMLGSSANAAGMMARTVPMLVVIFAIVFVAMGSPTLMSGLSVVGEIPAGLPGFSLAFVSAGDWQALAPSALLIALVGYVESISVARVLAQRRREKIDADQELLALGLSNLAAAVVGAMPVAGGFSRSVVNFEAGARTQVAAIIAAALVAVVALFFTASFYHLPHAVLAAIIVVAVSGLVDWRGARQILSYDRSDGLTLIVTLLGVLIWGIEIGLVMGVVVAALLYLRRTSDPHMAILGRVPGTEHFRNVQRHAVESTPELLIIRVDENLYFANIAAVERYILRSVVAAPETRFVVLVMSAVSYVDSSAEEELEQLNAALEARQVQLHLAEVKGPVMDRLQATGLGRQLRSRIHLSTHIAVQKLTGAESLNRPQ